MTRARPRIRVAVAFRDCRTAPAATSRASTLRAPDGEQPSIRASVAAPRPALTFTEPPRSSSQPDDLVLSTISSSARRSVAAPRPVRPASRPGGVGSLPSGSQPGPNNASISRSRTASSTFESTSGCLPPCFFTCRWARHSGITRQSSPVGWPHSFGTTWVCRALVRFSGGSTSWWIVDVDTPSHRPSSAHQIDVCRSFFRPLDARDFAYNTIVASRAASPSPSRDGSASSAWTAARSLSRIGRPSRSASSCRPPDEGTARNRRLADPAGTSLRSTASAVAVAALIRLLRRASWRRA
ncbi:hypothetical protein C0R01_31530 [Streptomyces albidoflavus]|nr:hypothetical protein C0R00_22770 [Streptomyces albidoflavus]RZE65989.1 hypothetical protein C0R01_31530 [Streptomyces albidoflavus]